MSILRRLSARLAGWADDTITGRRALTQERIAKRLVEDRLLEQLRLNVQLVSAQGRRAAGGAE